jgi:phosphoribosylaminoimidazolecarboxamide formyltransferase/IMP cyclohydrolase
MASSGGSEGADRPPTVPVSENRLALISVSDKSGIADFARGLVEHGYHLLSTGGTAAALRESGLAVRDVSEYTGAPEIMAGRVKTLHPRIHGGLLGREGEDEGVMTEQGIRRIAMLVLNLYPFEKVSADPDCRFEDAIENIDIGGPAMLRSAAKNFQSVAVVTSPRQYEEVLEALRAGSGVLDQATRYGLAVSAFNLVARYDGAISNWLSSREPGNEVRSFPDQANPSFIKLEDLRYGENPHQRAAWYRDPDAAPGTLSSMRQLQGKALSFNNIADADAAWGCVRQFSGPSCVIVKHSNPCGVATAADLITAYDRAHATDSTSAFGGVIAFNGEVDEDCAKEVLDRQFVELIMAPSFTSAALGCMSAKENLRVLTLSIEPVAGGLDIRSISGGALIQSPDEAMVTQADCQVVSRRQPDDDEWADLLFAWKVAKIVKSNAIVYAAGGRTLGIGAGQMSRVDSARIAAWKAQDAKLALQGSAMASDAFFPFRDSIDTAAAAGIAAVIQPGGSRRDDEVISAADEHDMVMVFTGMRHFRH